MIVYLSLSLSLSLAMCVYIYIYIYFRAGKGGPFGSKAKAKGAPKAMILYYTIL